MKYRMITKAARSLPANFPDVKCMFLRRVVLVVWEYSIPPSLFINIDEAGVLTSMSKMDLGPIRCPTISAIGWGDERRFTVLLAISAEGRLMRKVQILWAEEIERCHSKGDDIDGTNDLFWTLTAQLIGQQNKPFWSVPDMVYLGKIEGKSLLLKMVYFKSIWFVFHLLLPAVGLRMFHQNKIHLTCDLSTQSHFFLIR